MSIWRTLTELLEVLLERYDLAAVFVMVLLEEMGLPLPLPGDVGMAYAGYRVAIGAQNLVFSFVVLVTATLIGSSILYWVARQGGRPLLVRFGKYIHLNERRLTSMEDYFRKRGIGAVIMMRLIPGFRILTPMACGALGVPFRVFFPALAVSGSLYVGILMAIGYYLGPNALELLHAIPFTRDLVVNLLLLIILVIVGWRMRSVLRNVPLREGPFLRHLQAAVLSGFAATLAMTSLLNVFLEILGAFNITPPEIASLLDRLILNLRYDINQFRSIQLLASIIIYFAGGIFWALVYELALSDHLPGSPLQRGLLFSLLPLWFNLYVFLPLIGAGFLGLDLGVGWWPLVLEALRTILYGLVLGPTDAALVTVLAKPNSTTKPQPIVRDDVLASQQIGGVE